MKKDLNVILSHTEQQGECLVWTRCLNTDGYPRAVIDGNNNAKIHRVVYELVHQTDITGSVVRHTCDNPKCINPDHLCIGTAGDNMRDRDERQRHGAAKLSHDDVRFIRDHVACGVSQKDLANLFGVDHRTVSSLINRKHWKHVT